MNRTIPKKCDVLVIGGGPAGSIAAGRLAMAGFEVVLLEKASFPRPNVGESLIPYFWKFTDLIGASEMIENEGFLIKKGGIVHWEGHTRKVSFSSFGFKRPALHVERDIFDDLLLKRSRQLGVQVFEQVKVTSVEPAGIANPFANYNDLLAGEEGVVAAKYIIDASGQQAVISSQNKIRQFDRDFAFQSVWGYYDKSDYYDQNSERRPFSDRTQLGPLTTISSIGNWGWSWHILLRQKVSVGIVLPKSHMASFKEGGDRLDTRFKAFVPQIPLIGDLLTNSKLIEDSISSVRDYAYHSEKLAFKNYFLTGDAAAFVDPISSEGVPMAMYGGYLASWAIINSLKKKSRSAFFQKLFEQEYYKRLAMFKMLAFPSKQLPNDIKLSGQETLNGMSSQELDLIMAQAKLTDREDNFKDLFGSLSNREEVKGVDDVIIKSYSKIQ